MASNPPQEHPQQNPTRISSFLLPAIYPLKGAATNDLDDLVHALADAGLEEVCEGTAVPRAVIGKGDRFTLVTLRPWRTWAEFLDVAHQTFRLAHHAHEVALIVDTYHRVPEENMTSERWQLMPEDDPEASEAIVAVRYQIADHLVTSITETAWEYERVPGGIRLREGMPMTFKVDPSSPISEIAGVLANALQDPEPPQDYMFRLADQGFGFMELA